MAGQGITRTEYTQLSAWCLSSVASSDADAFVMPFLGMSARENIVHFFQARRLDVLEDRAA